ncbi:phospholipase D family protein [Noviherbaspirillum denitrificans]|uniref:phospholipase D n=1 Tax=Noviherbaspirillum denitrificans TaxID=1968433 RepID=A0A254THC9_9BURK|nr:phospholipase D family protein [Noviherbaspirillum denitrificans]OWW22051.1 endonuclease [Noviherbaspirillum denitrificans]
MNGRTSLVVAFLSLALTGVATAGPVFPAQGTLQPVFAPWEDVETAIIDVLAGARRQVLVQAYLLTSKKIASTLVAAHRRGVDVRVLVDGGQLEKVPSSMAGELSAAGVPVWVDNNYQNAHNKVIVVDANGPAATVITGSFNYTWTAQHKNAENILIARNNPALASRFAENWERHRQEATPFKK